MNQEPPQKPFGRFEKLRSAKYIRRRLRKIESATLRHAHTFIVRRWDNIRDVRRHSLVWLLLLGVLISSLALQLMVMQSAYQAPLPVAGGTYAEGVIGQFETLNPIFAASPAERAASKLAFAGLLGYDQTGAVTGDLAQSWSAEAGGKRFVVTLRPNLLWQDGKPLTAADVVFTIKSIQDPLARSPLQAAWQSISVKQLDGRRVEFDLPAPFAPFPQLLTVGILPAHQYAGIKPADMRGADSAKLAVGSGPFSVSNLQLVDKNKGRLIIRFTANANYWRGAPMLDRFRLHVFKNREDLRRAFLSGEVNAVPDFSLQEIRQIESVKKINITEAPLNNVVMAIFRTDEGPLKDIKVRQALALAADRQAIVDGPLSGRVTALNIPLPRNLVPGLADLGQPGYNLAAAEQMLASAGWQRAADGKLANNGQPLRLNAVTVKSGDYPKVLEALAGQWAKLGVAVNISLVNPESVQQDVIAPRAYDVLLYEMSVGADPDVFAYWHSSQANAQGLNLANFRSAKTDDALDSARSRPETDLRVAKYRTFVEDWINSAPGVALYQARLHYVSNPDVTALTATRPLVDSVDRYRNVLYWSVAKEPVNLTP